MTLSTLGVYKLIALCLTAFGLGYGGGSLQRIIRRSVEVLD